jgi:hypothetical protein
MHIAYACVGRLDDAFECLLRADQAASQVEEYDDIFTVKSYEFVTVGEFRAINKEMLLALNKNVLWDGMKIPSKRKKDLDLTDPPKDKRRARSKSNRPSSNE